MKEKTLILVGGGHAHVYLINNLIQKKAKFKTILISAKRYQYYSGMASAYLENIYSDDEIAFDLEKLSEMAGIKFYENKVISFDPKSKKVIIDSGEEIKFDVISFDTGSELLIPEKFKGIDNILGIKPLTNLKKIKKTLKESTKKDMKISILGGGAAGVETALALKELEKQIGKNLKIEILERGKDIFLGFDNWLREIAKQEINQKNISIVSNYEMVDTDDRKFDYMIWAGGPTSSPMYREAGLSVDEKGYMLLTPQLQSIDFPYIFGAGDCVNFEDYDYVKKVGVYAIREAPYLWENILDYMEGKNLKTFHPQKKYLLIISLGGRRAMLSYYGIKLKGRLVWRIKNFIDSSFMKKFQRYD